VGDRVSFLIAFGLAVVVVPLAGWIGSALGIVDRPSDPSLKIHPETVPLVGGIAVVACALGAYAIRHGHFPILVLAGVALALAGGLVDDIRPLPAWPRFLLQASVGLLLVAGGVRLTPLGPLAGLGVVALVVATANAVNIMDGQDGLAGGLAAIAAIGLAGLAFRDGPSFVVGIGLSLAGGLAGFLVWNMARAKIFLGNSGAYAVGTVLALLAARISAWYGWRGLVASGVCLGVFALELAATVVRRVVSRTPLSSGDRLHSYDLVARRTGRGLCTALFWGLGVLAAGLGYLTFRLPLPGSALTASAAAVAGAAGGALLWRGLPAREIHGTPSTT
jgi:UDP-GlcNAc:undecaprenyl-phosphate GlcNAc-1-phosphate transferase